MTAASDPARGAPAAAPDPSGEDGPLARVVVTAGVSIVVPTYRERENIPLLIERVRRLRDAYGVDCELLFMDDDSRDGSVEAVGRCGLDWVRIVVRTRDRGLSPAVVDGFRLATKPVLVCMDCDLSHPPESIPQMILALEAGQRFVIGSRYVSGASTDDDWGIFRWLNSLVATALARPLTSVRDPMSGFFVMRRRDFLRARDLNPIGYKIGLELIVKCGFDNVAEIPIHFSDRVHGESKLTIKQQLLYIQHLRRLYMYKFSNAMYFIQFAAVGASGVAVNLVVVSLMQLAGAPETACIAAGIGVSVATNFILNRRFTFSYARHGNVVMQFAAFLGAAAVGAAVNYAVAVTLQSRVFSDVSFGLQLSVLCGVAAGMAFNFLGNRYLVFRKKFVRRS